MGIFRKILAEGKDLASVVDGIKKAVMNFKAHQDQEEALFGKELSKVEDQASKALLAIAKVLDQNKAALEAMGDEKWGGRVNPKLMECGQSVMGLAEPLATTLAEMSNAKKPKTESSEDCRACKGSGLVKGGDECEPCQGTGMLEPEPAMAKKESKKSEGLEDCPSCDGIPPKDGSDCQTCAGMGVLPTEPADDRRAAKKRLDMRYSSEPDMGENKKTEDRDDDFDGRERPRSKPQRPNLPCPRCKAKNVLTADDSARGRVCDTCADAAERGHGRYGYSFENKKAKK